MPEAAAHLGMEPRALRTWVRKFVAAGVLVETREVSRGRCQSRDRPSAAALFVPFERVPRLTLEVMFERAEAVPLGLLHRNLLALAHGALPGLHRWGSWLAPGEDGPGVDVQVGPPTHEVRGLQAFLRDEDGPAALMCWIPLRLDFNQAKDFQRELGALIERYQHRGGAQPYLARIALTPLLTS